MNITPLRLFTIAPLLLATLPSQDQNAQALPARHIPIHTAPDDMGVAYGTWAAAESYKVSFHDGMTFVPYLGAEYPHNQPLSWQTTSVRVGETELLERGPSGICPPAHWHDDYRYEYRFGAVTECYDVLQEGLEQTFIVHQLPTSGDLVIKGAVTSSMHAANVEPAHQALTFFDEKGDAIVGYGEAFAFDANGVRIPISTSFRDGEITLALPEAWVAQAALPITVDPLLTRQQVTSINGSTGRSVDIAWDDEAAQANVMFVTVFAASQFDDDVSALLCEDDFTPRVVPFYDVTSTWDSDGASCAFVGGGDKWAIVFRRYFGGASLRVSLLRCHVHTSGSLATSTSVGYLSAPQGYNDWRPDVGGVASHQAGNHALVVFQRETNTGTAGHWAQGPDTAVYGSLLDVTSTNGTFGSAFAIWDHNTTDIERPSVNKIAEGGSSFSWICALQLHDNTAGDDWDVYARRIDNLGGVANTAWGSGIGLLNTDHQLGPVVEGADGRYAVTFATTDLITTPTKTSQNRGQKIWVERLDWAHGSNIFTGGHQPALLVSNAAKVYEVSGLGYDTFDDSHWAVGFRTVSPAVPSAQVARVGYTGVVTEGPVTLYTNGGHTTLGVECVFERDHDSFLCAYGVSQPPQTGPIYGQVFEYPQPGLEVVGGTSCSGVGMDWLGNQQIGAEFNRVFVYNASPTTGHFMLVSLGTANLPLVDPAVSPGCNLLIDNGGGFLGTMNFQIGGNVSWYFALPEWLTPFTLHFQDWMLDGNSFTSSRRLSVPLIK